MDPTTVQVADPARPGKIRRARVWGLRARDGPMWYDFALSESGERIAELVEDYQGILQTDGARESLTFMPKPARRKTGSLCVPISPNGDFPESGPVVQSLDEHRFEWKRSVSRMLLL